MAAGSSVMLLLGTALRLPTAGAQLGSRLVDSSRVINIRGLRAFRKGLRGGGGRGFRQHVRVTRGQNPHTRVKRVAKAVFLGLTGLCVGVSASSTTSSCFASGVVGEDDNAAADDDAIEQQQQKQQQQQQQPQRQSEAPPLFRFGVIADVQYADINNGTSFGGGEYRYYRGTANNLQAAVSWWNKECPDIRFVAQLGDLIDGQNAGKYGEGLNFTVPQSETAFQHVMSHLERCTCKAWHHAVGNHELYNFERDDLHRKLFVDKQHTSPDRLYYSFSPHPGWRFLMLDAYDIALEGRDQKSDKYKLARSFLEENNPNIFAGKSWFEGIPKERQRFVPFNGGVSDEQLEWLRSELHIAEKKGENTIIMSHIPLIPSASSHKTCLWNYPKVLSTIRNFKSVKMILAGHFHPGGYALDDEGIHHVTIHGSLTHADLGSYGVIEVHRDFVELKGVGHLPSRRMKFQK
mmetsp:Transcript_24525/g.43521  ORF Transcript_24525/g.43521 Transcript_24525/m.43521 type:complete len:462 (-) Transcript_24525:59-1444(-)|eukprot:CAMPEP_0197523804 /NCGR_PEP_ID=MMETSP1318-20131121/8658_1 /TAXON_ID=552666 /ORGANISM="Partenskyella glossopodia, Strain RCC365" /LENGTH=461 /DNA_ID=CAMNT_0043076605 /DNA_START=115 /DNA_END=1500 /DNA_ORIENTATION=-